MTEKTTSTELQTLGPTEAAKSLTTPASRRAKNPATYGIKAEIIAAICKVDVATARRWKSGVSQMPYAVTVLVTGDIGGISPTWRGWRVQGDVFISPDGWTIRRDDALTVPLMLGQISALRAELEKYKALANTEEQPAPPDVLPQIIG